MGSEKHLRLVIVSSDDVTMHWIEGIDNEDLLLDGRIKGTRYCADTLIRLEGLEFPISVPQVYQDSARTVLGEKYDSIDVPWRYMMPRDVYRDFLKKSVYNTVKCLDGVSSDYLQKVWTSTEEVFSYLRPSWIDRDALLEFLHDEESESQRAALQSFMPGSTKYVGPPVYSRFGTRTGRLTVMSGPQILTIKKDYRGVIGSTYKDGVVVSMDFVGLEARVAYLEAHETLEDVDVYEHINTEHFSGSLPREVVKSAVLCELFGMGATGLALKLGVSVDRAEKFMGKLRDLFGIDELTSRLKHQFIQEGFIRNRFGRRVVVPELRLLLNSYVQSTGVDVALLGFRTLVRRLADTLPEVRPLMVLHDDLMVDCPNYCLDELKKINIVRVLGYKSPFYVKVKIIEQLQDSV